MRSDMKDVLKDHGSRGFEEEKYWTRTRINREKSENLPKIIPHGKSWLYGGFGWNPLRNFLLSRVGQLWDDVYSEICAATDRRSYRGYSLFKNLRYMVETSEPRWRGFYVDKDRILRYYEGRKHTTKIVPVTKLPSNLGPNEWYELDGGQWYSMSKEVQTYKSVRRDEWLEEIDGEVVVKESSKEYLNNLTTITKRQVGKRTLKKIRARLREMK